MATRISPEEFAKRYGQDTLSQFSPTKRQVGFFEATLDAAKDIPSDIREIGTGVSESFTRGIETAGEAREQVTAGEISPVAGTVKTIGGGLKAGAEAIGEGVLGLLKLPFSQRAEERVAGVVEAGAEKVVDTEIVQSALTKYNELSPENKALVDGVLGTTEGLATMLGASPALRAGKVAITSPVKAVERGLRSIDEATAELRQFNLPSVQGIDLAKKAGVSPEDLMQRVARINKTKQAKFEARAGESVGSYLVSRNVFGTPDQIAEQLYKRLKDSKGRVDESLLTVKGDFKAPQVKTALDQLIERDVRITTEGAKHVDSDRITQLFTKYNQQGLNLSEVNEVKRLFERNVKVGFLRENVADGIEKSNAISSSLRNLVEDKATKGGVETVRELNRETSLAKQLLDDIGAEHAGSAGNNAIGLTDSIFLAEALGSANPVAAIGFAFKKGLSSKAIMSQLAKRTSKQAGSKEALPEVPDSDVLTGYLKFLESQVNQTGQ